MKREHPFIGKTRDELDGKRWKKLGPAERLLDFLKSRQTGPKGEVYYHKEIGYAWIRSKIPNPPPERTLKRWMERIKDLGEAVVTRTAYGMKIRLVNSRKWAQQTSLFAQAGNLFSAEHPGLPMPVENLSKTAELPVLRSAKSGTREVPEVAPGRSYIKTRQETINTPRAVRADSPAQNGAAKQNPYSREWRQQQKARRLLREIEVLRECYVGSYGDDLARRDFKLGLLYDELAKTGWQDARAG